MKCPINEIQDDLTRNMAWEFYRHIDFADLHNLYMEYLYCGRIGEAITAARLKKTEDARGA